MPGTFTGFNKSRPGAYFNFTSEEVVNIPPAPGSIVALGIQHDWGPWKQVRLVQSYQEFLATYGDSDTSGKLAVKQAFVGEGYDDRAGAGGVLVYRYGPGAAVKASSTLQSAEATPAATLTLTALNEGTKGNSIRRHVEDTPGITSSNDLVLTEVGTGRELERYTHADTDMPGLAAAINARSLFVRAAVTTGSEAKPLWAASGTNAAINGTPTALTGGTDGTGTLGPTDFSAMRTAFEFERFGIFCVAGLTDSSEHTALRTWALSRNQSGHRFRVLIGGGSENVAAANTRSTTMNSPYVLNTGGYTVIYDDDGTQRTLYGADLAPRIAGILASRGETRSATFARMAGLTLSVPPSSADVDTAFNAGTIVLSRGFGANPVRIEKSLTTYTTRTNPKVPYAIYRNPKFMASMESLEVEVTDLSEGPGIIGELGVNDDTRAALVAIMNERLGVREGAGIIQGGWSVGIEQNPPPSDDDEFVALRYSLRFMRTVEQVYGTVVVA